MRTAVIDSSGTVVNLMVGEITPDQQAAFGAHFARRYGDVWFLVVDGSTPVWVDGTYDEATGFTPPPAPEPQPEPQPEPLMEPEI